MSKFITTLKDSFKLLLKEPKLFLPKIVLSLLFIPYFLLYASYVLQLEQVINGPGLPAADLLYGLLIPVLAIGLYALLLDMLDYILINPMYMFLVKDFFDKKPLSFALALRGALGKIFPMALSMLLIAIVTLLLWSPFLVLYAFSFLTGNIFLMGLSIILLIAVAFAVVVVFYFTYPVLSLEGKGFLTSMKSIVKMSLKNKRDVSKATGIVMFFMILSYVFAFIVESLGAPGLLLSQAVVLIAFVFFRLVMAVFITYQYVLNPVFYLEYERGMVLGEEK